CTRPAADPFSPLSLHDALPISISGYAEPEYDPDELLGLVPTDPKTPFDPREVIARITDGPAGEGGGFDEFKPLYGPSLVTGFAQDRKSTRLNSSHVSISYAVFC